MPNIRRYACTCLDQAFQQVFTTCSSQLME